MRYIARRQIATYKRKMKLTPQLTKLYKAEIEKLKIYEERRI